MGNDCYHYYNDTPDGFVPVSTVLYANKYV